MKIINVVGARPNFMKIAPLIRAIDKYNKKSSSSPANNTKLDSILVHSGQHYDYNMSKVFFEELKIPQPDIHLEVGSGSHAEQTGRVLIEFEKILIKEKPDLVIVVGDVNSTLSCALAAVKLHIPVAHVEAGLRSFDCMMPEEINRKLTDAISDYLFTPSIDADENLVKEGVAKEKIFLVGDIMVDSLLFNLKKAKESDILNKLGLANGAVKNFALLTLHRPSNVDDSDSLSKILQGLKRISKNIPIILPIHPRTRKQVERFGFQDYFSHIDSQKPVLSSVQQGLYSLDPLGYFDFLNLMMHSKFVMTDSGGIQEESTVLGIPCLTLRDTTERPITISQGTNVLVHHDIEKMNTEVSRILAGCWKKSNCPRLWDGKTADRIIEILTNGHRRF
jgi:UDP-N-acetylglucosamine 2-epimerase (non-hydrolysing)